MKKSFSRAIALTLTLALIFTSAVFTGMLPTAFAADYTNVNTNKVWTYEYGYAAGTKFIQDVVSGYDGDDLETVQNQMRGGSYGNGVSYTPDNLDTASGVKSAVYSTIGWSYTTEPDFAITGIITNDRENTNDNPRTASNYHRYKYAGTKASVVFAEVNINYTTTKRNLASGGTQSISVNGKYNDGHNDMLKDGKSCGYKYVYTSRDREIGPPITEVDIFDTTSGTTTAAGGTGWRAVGSFGAPNSACSTTNGAGATRIIVYRSSCDALDSAVLRDTVAQAQSYYNERASRYTTASANALKNAFEAAADIVLDLNARGFTAHTAAQVNTAVSNLNNAIDELQTNVTFNGNGGTIAGPTSTSVTIGGNSSITIDVPCTAVRSGYTFSGWSTDVNATECSERVTIGYNSTVYAIWEKNISARFWRINGSIATAETVNTTIHSNQTEVEVTAAQPPMTANYDGRVLNWLGFTTEDTANSSTEVSTELTRTISGGEEFNSLYSGNVSLRFNANGGSSAPSQQTQKQYLNANKNGVTGTGASFTIAATVPVKTGNTFLGWAFDSNAETAQYQPGDTVDGINTNSELFAIWSPNTYYVKYNSNGGTGVMANSTHKYGVPSALTKNVYTKAYTVTFKSNDGRPDTTSTATAVFNGWATSSVGAAQYADEQTVTGLSKAPEAVVNLFANWTNGSIELPNITRKGYEFRGWYTNAQLTNLAGGAGENYTPRTNENLYAMWDPNTYNVIYDGNGATGGATTRSTHIYGTAQPLSLNGFVKEYSVIFEYNDATGGERPVYMNVSSPFAGWAETADGPALYTDGEDVMNLAESGNKILYATWSSGSILLPAPEKANHIFRGWYKDAGYEQFAGSAGALFTTDVQTTLYAKWEEINDPELVSAPGSSTVIDNNGDFIYGLPDRDVASAADLLTANLVDISGGTGYVTYEYSNNENVIGTGTKVNLFRNDGTFIKSYTIIIYGDNDGDGYITMADITDATYFDALLDSTYDYEDMSIANVKAMDVNADGMVDQRDISIVTYYAAMLIDEIDQTGAGTQID